jgi:hypothetical protein
MTDAPLRRPFFSIAHASARLHQAAFSQSKDRQAVGSGLGSKLIVIEPLRVGDRTDEKNWPEIPWLCHH